MAKKKRKSRKDSERAGLVKAFKKAVRQANAKLQKMNKSGLRELNPQYSKKWETFLQDRKYTTKAGMWKGTYQNMSKANLNKAIAILTTFNENLYNTVEFTRSYVDNSKEKWGIESDDTLKAMYKAAREYGYLNQYDSDIEAVSEIALWYNRNPKGDFEEWAEKFASQFAEEQQRQYDINDLKSALIRYNQNPTEYPYGL